MQTKADLMSDNRKSIRVVRSFEARLRAGQVVWPTRMASVTLLLSIFVWGVPLGSVAARSRLVQNPVAQAPLVEASPTVAPFQHVRFCLHYPAECKSDATENERIELIVQNLEFLNFVRIDRTFRIGHVDHVFPARSADARSRIERALRESGLPE